MDLLSGLFKCDSRRRVVGWLWLSCVLTPASQGGSTLEVGPGKPYPTIPSAVAAAVSGDTLEISPGTYSGAAAVAVIGMSLTIRGVGGRPILDAAGYNIPNGKAIFVTTGPEIMVENLEFKNAAVPDHNGAGIRPEGGKLTVRSCYFHDNENGIQGGAVGSEILVESCEFEHNGRGDGQSHNVYINVVRRLTFRFNYSHRGNIGHLLKTRAEENYILYNRLTDEIGGAASYEVDVPQGGLTFLIGNIVEQSVTTENSTVIAYAEEGAKNSTNRLYLAHNTLLNNRSGGVFLRNASASPAVLINNLFLGPGTVVSGPAAQTNNLTLDRTLVADALVYDVHLKPAAKAIDWGANLGIQDGFDLTPVWEYQHPLRAVVRRFLGSPDVGAFECTDPAGNFLHFTEAGIVNGSIELRWLGNPAMNRILESTPTLSPAVWVSVSTNPPGEAAAGLWTVPAAGAATFFRLQGAHP